jgi:hypothetical protein
MSEESKRVRMNLSQTAKGTWQADITAEFPTPEEAEENLRKAIESVRRVAAEKGLTLVSIN